MAAVLPSTNIYHHDKKNGQVQYQENVCLVDCCFCAQVLIRVSPLCAGTNKGLSFVFRLLVESAVGRI